jgi:predicted nucleotidyltransferase
MRKFLLIVAGLSIFGALWRTEAEEDGSDVALSPFLAALVIEAAILLLTRKRNDLLSEGGPVR